MVITGIQSARYTAIVAATAESSVAKHLEEIRWRLLESENPQREQRDLAGPGSSHKQPQTKRICSNLCRRAQPPLQATKVSTQSTATAGRSIVAENMDGVFRKHQIDAYDVSTITSSCSCGRLDRCYWKLNTAEKRQCERFLAECGRQFAGTADK